MTILDEMPDDLRARCQQADDATKADGRRGNRSQADVLVTLAERAPLFHTPYNEAYADVPAGGHRETLKVRGTEFRLWLQHLFYSVYHKAPNAESMAGALGVIEARARFEGPERPVHVRTAEHEGRIYIDLCDSHWRSVEIDAEGWRVVDAPPVRFRRTKGMHPLPAPVAGGTIDALRPFLNVSTDADFVLAVALILAALRPRGPFPILGLAGEQGSAKSTFCGMIRSLIDPNAAALRALPPTDRDLFIAASNGWVLAFDNVSRIPPWLSDALCRIATGGGFAVRALYTDDDEHLFSASRPILLNGIEDVISRADLADRSVFLMLSAIPEEHRRPERELWEAFAAAQPGIQGALYTAVSHGLRMLPTTRLHRLPRMADFALWIAACEGALWSAGTFAAAYDQNRSDAVAASIESDQVAGAVQKLMADAEWEGTAAELLAKLSGIVGTPLPKDWPATPQGMGGKLRRAAPAIRKVGIEVEYAHLTDKKKTRIIRLRRAPERAVGQTSETSETPAGAENASAANGLASDDFSDVCTARSSEASDRTSDAQPASELSDDAPDGVPANVRANVRKKSNVHHGVRGASDVSDVSDDVLTPLTARPARTARISI